jgi:hypothetical protein
MIHNASNKVESYLNGERYLEHVPPAPIAGRDRTVVEG